MGMKAGNYGDEIIFFSAPGAAKSYQQIIQLFLNFCCNSESLPERKLFNI